MAKVPAAEDRRLILCLEGLGMSFAMLDHIHPELLQTCHRVKTESQPMSLALLKCWSFVDVVHRIREISEALPGMNGRTPQVRSFLEATASAEVCRNYIQHLRGELMKPEPNRFPVWGSISWIDPDDQSLSHTADSGTRVGDISSTSAIYDTVEGKWASSVSLNIEGAIFHFDPIFDECKKFQGFVIPWILGTFKLPLTELTGPSIFSVRFRVSVIRPEHITAEYLPNEQAPPTTED